MASRSKLLALLLVVVLPMLACQFVSPAQKSCRVNMPATGWVLHRHGEQVNFTIDAMDWSARVDCTSGHLVDGEPVQPSRAKQISIPVEETTYRLITADSSVNMIEQHANGSHVRIDADGVYYLVSMTVSSASLGNAVISYFVGGQAAKGLAHLYCYNRTPGQAHTSLSAIAAMWTMDEPVTVRLVCSGRNFVLEISADVTSAMLKQGPAPIPITPVPTITPEAPGSHL